MVALYSSSFRAPRTKKHYSGRVMVSTLVVTLGKVAESLIDSGKRIMGKSFSMGYLCVEWGAGLDEVKAHLRERILRIDKGDGVLLLTDIFGSTATNIALELKLSSRIEVVTGVNLPMVIYAATLPSGITLDKAAERVRIQGCGTITIASEDS